MTDLHYYATVSFDGTVNDQGGTDGTVPAGTTIITKEQYDTLVAVSGLGGHCKFVNGVLIPTAPISTPAPPSLEAVKVAAYIQIDDAAERARAYFLTPGSGQAMEYQATQADAARAIEAIAAGATTLEDNDYPWLAAERTAMHSANQTASIIDVAHAVMAQQQAWVAAGSAIKEKRRSAKLRVESVNSVNEVIAILNAITW